MTVSGKVTSGRYFGPERVALTGTDGQVTHVCVLPRC